MRDLVQDDLADAAGVTRSAVSELERSISKTTKPENLFAFARRLNVDPGLLATGEAYYPESIPPDIARFVRMFAELPEDRRNLVCYLIAALNVAKLDTAELIRLIDASPRQ